MYVCVCVCVCVEYSEVMYDIYMYTMCLSVYSRLSP